MNKTVNNPGAALANTMSLMYDDNNQGGSFTPIQLKVHNIFKSNNSMNGMHLNALLSNFPQGQHPQVQYVLTTMFIS